MSNMKTGQGLDRGVSQQSLAESYQVPALDGRMVQAIPLKFCLNFRPPTIAVVYTFQHSSSKKKTGKVRKYIHEIKVDFKSCTVSMIGGKELPTLKEIEKLTAKLCDQEPTYLNINIIAQTQVSILSHSDSHSNVGSEIDQKTIRESLWMLTTYYSPSNRH